jgi:spore germination cell wall hydrolase CwlJ-like protein
MGTSRTRALEARHPAHFWLGAFCVALLPTVIGYQDIAALTAKQPVVPHHTHLHLIASPFGTIEPATYSYGHRPLGTAMPQPPGVLAVNVDPQMASRAMNRQLKGDRLPSTDSAALATGSIQTSAAAAPPATPAVIAAVARVDTDLPSEIPAAGQIDAPDGQQSLLAPFAFAEAGAEERAQGYFGPRVVATSSFEPGIKFSALEEPAEEDANGESASDKNAAQLQSPAQRLGLAGNERVRAEKCLANAVYFEARGEPLRGQEAVAQVVMNRVFSGYYPNNVCGVVYQNAGRYLGCQFTFACEHKNLDRIDEPDMWAQAKRIVKDTLDGKVWLADIGPATHYHAYWVRPSWVHEMTKLYKLGVHTFYRPRAWGKGNYEPVWGTAPNKTANGGA